MTPEKRKAKEDISPGQLAEAAEQILFADPKGRSLRENRSPNTKELARKWKLTRKKR